MNTLTTSIVLALGLTTYAAHGQEISADLSASSDTSSQTQVSATSDGASSFDANLSQQSSAQVNSQLDTQPNTELADNTDVANTEVDATDATVEDDEATEASESATQDAQSSLSLIANPVTDVQSGLSTAFDNTVSTFTSVEPGWKCRK